jgi:hypothetical protein
VRLRSTVSVKVIVGARSSTWSWFRLSALARVKTRGKIVSRA